MIQRIKRYIEIAKYFGWFNSISLRHLFPYYRGWDIGCGYCACEQDAMKSGRCERGIEYGWQKCGTTERSQTNDNNKR